MRGASRRLLVALMAGAGLVLAAPSAAHANEIAEIPANSPGGISVTLSFGGAVVPQPYTPDPSAYWGPDKCLLIYHDYVPTPGCGGFTFNAKLHNVQAQPGYIEGLSGGDFEAYADTARTFGCLDGDGVFQWDTSFVVRTERTPLSDVYYTAGMDYILQQFRTGKTLDQGPYYFLNFEAVEFGCAEGTTPTQFGLMVTNLRLDAVDSPVFGDQTWTAAGPFYG
ncbi:hypothetical protein [Streptomyces sp. AK02-01A]|uniref:hypothetical protein n=1 Tax=Streptomyces sp. AK02-01A TaxID=3028648 RepID=UPI0029B8E463|nr:hypothetical protein [Streptomyces sp. AK02-01A]MDX3852326.1 hypothetical protein [Streptomyces sp. AK02-01A]